MPEKILPTTAKFFVADEIRTDGNAAKPTLFGLYTDDVIVVLAPEEAPDPSDEKPATLEGIAILSAFDIALGAFEGEITVRRPDGTEIYNAKGELKAEKEGPLLFVAKFQPFIVQQLGQYTYSIKIDDRVFEHTFEVRRKTKQKSEPQLHLDVIER